MSRNLIVRIFEDSQGHPEHIEILIPRQPVYPDGCEAPEVVVFNELTHTVISFPMERPTIIQHRPIYTGEDVDRGFFDVLGTNIWRDFLEGLDEISPPLIQVYPYICGICHKVELYAEDPELEDFRPYHCHGHHKPPKSVLGTLARVYHLRRLSPRWVPNNTPMVLYKTKVHER